MHSQTLCPGREIITLVARIFPLLVHQLLVLVQLGLQVGHVVAVVTGVGAVAGHVLGQVRGVLGHKVADGAGVGADVVDGAHVVPQRVLVVALIFTPILE